MLVFQKNNEKDPYSGPQRSGFTFTYSSQLNCSLLFGGEKGNSDIWIYDHCKGSHIQLGEIGNTKLLIIVENCLKYGKIMQLLSQRD